MNGAWFSDCKRYLEQETGRDASPEALDLAIQDINKYAAEIKDHPEASPSLHTFAKWRMQDAFGKYDLSSNSKPLAVNPVRQQLEMEKSQEVQSSESAATTQGSGQTQEVHYII